MNTGGDMGEPSDRGLQNAEETSAISEEDYTQLGCPNCGHIGSIASVHMGNSVFRKCSKCGLGFIVLKNGETKSSIQVGKTFPELVDHPHKGVQS